MEYLLIGLVISIIYCIIILPEKSGCKPNLSFNLYPIIYDGMLIIPISDNFSAMRISICVQILNLFSSVQIFSIIGLLYLGIILFFINHLLENQYCFLIK